jgi:hypothetical protein
MSESRIESLTCCCCGSGLKGRQWWNRDTGFGLCNGCIAFVGIKDGEDYADSYGHRGIHWGVAL